MKSRLTAGEANLIAPHQAALRNLDEGRRKPRTALQNHFIAVRKYDAAPTTKYEKAYLKWRELGFPDLRIYASPSVRGSESDIKRSKNVTRQPAKKSPRANQSPNETSPITEMEADRRAQLAIRAAHGHKTPRFQEPLGSREDFRRDAQRNWGRSRQPK